MNPLSRLIPVIPPLKARSLASDLKARLDWGEPALTIVDVRDRDDFNEAHICGAVSIPRAQLLDRALRFLELTRDIYIYGTSDEETARAAGELRRAGYRKVSELRGGVAAWKAFGFPIESSARCV
ncbi:rhodanese-like domain-containing protein [Oxynema aestuarii]|uniref:Rhodanese-like domain-containing protein n=1 Tax=Oxynema aestuarii AP17 TaxID=2064643 RepID=A0A6H1TVJ9_9CYAN|nr:rhodanese-like domain-containing protein [Oxynema aestuarii]QIZ69960.1 rhodanese-like domain-containing protein [Oxynema aestuarii AP17]